MKRVAVHARRARSGRRQQEINRGRDVLHHFPELGPFGVSPPVVPRTRGPALLMLPNVVHCLVHSGSHPQLIEAKDQVSLRGNQLVEPVAGASVVRVVVKAVVVVVRVQEDHGRQPSGFLLVGDVGREEEVGGVIRTKANKLPRNVCRLCMITLAVVQNPRIQVARAIVSVIDRPLYAVVPYERVLRLGRILAPIARTDDWTLERPLTR